MATATPRAGITADEFLAMDLGEGRFELVRGEVVAMSPPPDYWHGSICGDAYFKLHGFGRETGHGHAATNDSAVRINESTVRGADVCYYSEARWPRARVGQESPPVPPDLVVEVVSPSDRPSDVLEKVAEYLRAGVLMVWVIHPQGRTLTIYRPDDITPTVLDDRDTVENLPELPGFRCPVAEFFA
jgi:Uma2 family endonuclease